MGLQKDGGYKVVRLVYKAGLLWVGNQSTEHTQKKKAVGVNGREAQEIRDVKLGL